MNTAMLLSRDVIKYAEFLQLVLLKEDENTNKQTDFFCKCSKIHQ